MSLFRTMFAPAPPAVNLKRLMVHCSNPRRHFAPLAMTFSHVQPHHDGQPTYVYGCPVCGCVKAFVRHHATGGAHQLWWRRGV